MLDDLEQVEMISGHTFRHTFATRCIEAGVRPKTLQNFLGHSTIGMTMDLYVHNTDEAQKREMELFEGESSKISVSEERFIEKYKKVVKEENKIIAFFG